MRSIENYLTFIDSSKFPKDKLKYLDLEGLQRFHTVIRWNEVNDDVISIIRDLVMVQFSLDYKWLRPVEDSYEYAAQKTITNGDKSDIKSANILIEPLNNDYRSYISRIPINQKLEIDTNVSIDKSITFENDKDGKIPDRKFLHSGNLEFATKLPNPIINYFHIGSMEMGSIIKAKFKVAYVDSKIGKFRLFNFRRKDDANIFVLSIWKFYNLSIVELLHLIIDYVENKYEEPKFYMISANDHGANILNKEKLVSFARSLIREVEKNKEFKPIAMPEMISKLK